MSETGDGRVGPGGNNEQGRRPDRELTADAVAAALGRLGDRAGTDRTDDPRRTEDELSPAERMHQYLETEIQNRVDEQMADKSLGDKAKEILKSKRRRDADDARMREGMEADLRLKYADYVRTLLPREQIRAYADIVPALEHALQTSDYDTILEAYRNQRRPIGENVDEFTRAAILDDRKRTVEILDTAARYGLGRAEQHPAGSSPAGDEATPEPDTANGADDPPQPPAPPQEPDLDRTGNEQPDTRNASPEVDPVHERRQAAQDALSRATAALDAFKAGLPDGVLPRNTRREDIEAALAAQGGDALTRWQQAQTAVDTAEDEVRAASAAWDRERTRKEETLLRQRVERARALVRIRRAEVAGKAPAGSTDALAGEGSPEEKRKRVGDLQDARDEAAVRLLLSEADDPRGNVNELARDLEQQQGRLEVLAGIDGRPEQKVAAEALPLYENFLNGHLTVLPQLRQTLGRLPRDMARSELGILENVAPVDPITQRTEAGPATPAGDGPPPDEPPPPTEPENGEDGERREVVERILQNPDIVHQVNAWQEGYSTSYVETNSDTLREWEEPNAHQASGVWIKEGTVGDELRVIQPGSGQFHASSIINGGTRGGPGTQLPLNRGEAMVIEMVKDEPGHFRQFALVTRSNINPAASSRTNFGYFLSIPASETEILAELTARPEIMLDVLKGQYGLDRSSQDKIDEQDRQRQALGLNPVKLNKFQFNYTLPEDLRVVNTGEHMILPTVVFANENKGNPIRPIRTPADTPPPDEPPPPRGEGGSENGENDPNEAFRQGLERARHRRQLREMLDPAQAEAFERHVNNEQRPTTFEAVRNMREWVRSHLSRTANAENAEILATSVFQRSAEEQKGATALLGIRERLSNIVTAPTDPKPPYYNSARKALRELNTLIDTQDLGTLKTIRGFLGDHPALSGELNAFNSLAPAPTAETTSPSRPSDPDPANADEGRGYREEDESERAPRPTPESPSFPPDIQAYLDAKITEAEEAQRAAADRAGQPGATDDDREAADSAEQRLTYLRRANDPTQSPGYRTNIVGLELRGDMRRIQNAIAVADFPGTPAPETDLQADLARVETLLQRLAAARLTQASSDEPRLDFGDGIEGEPPTPSGETQEYLTRMRNEAQAAYLRVKAFPIDTEIAEGSHLNAVLEARDAASHGDYTQTETVLNERLTQLQERARGNTELDENLAAEINQVRRILGDVRRITGSESNEQTPGTESEETRALRERVDRARLVSELDISLSERDASINLAQALLERLIDPNRAPQQAEQDLNALTGLTPRERAIAEQLLQPAQYQPTADVNRTAFRMVMLRDTLAEMEDQTGQQADIAGRARRQLADVIWNENLTTLPLLRSTLNELEMGDALNDLEPDPLQPGTPRFRDTVNAFTEEVRAISPLRVANIEVFRDNPDNEGNGALNRLLEEVPNPSFLRDRLAALPRHQPPPARPRPTPTPPTPPADTGGPDTGTPGPDRYGPPAPEPPPAPTPEQPTTPEGIAYARQRIAAERRGITYEQAYTEELALNDGRPLPQDVWPLRFALDGVDPDGPIYNLIPPDVRPRFDEARAKREQRQRAGTYDASYPGTWNNDQRQEWWNQHVRDDAYWNAQQDRLSRGLNAPRVPELPELPGMPLADAYIEQAFQNEQRVFDMLTRLKRDRPEDRADDLARARERLDAMNQWRQMRMDTLAGNFDPLNTELNRYETQLQYWLEPANRQRDTSWISSQFPDTADGTDADRERALQGELQRVRAIRAEIDARQVPLPSLEEQRREAQREQVRQVAEAEIRILQTRANGRVQALDDRRNAGETITDDEYNAATERQTRWEAIATAARNEGNLQPFAEEIPTVIADNNAAIAAERQRLAATGDTSGTSDRIIRLQDENQNLERLQDEIAELFPTQGDPNAPGRRRGWFRRRRRATDDGDGQPAPTEGSLWSRLREWNRIPGQTEEDRVSIPEPALLTETERFGEPERIISERLTSARTAIGDARADEIIQEAEDNDTDQSIPLHSSQEEAFADWNDLQQAVASRDLQYAHGTLQAIIDERTEQIDRWRGELERGENGRTQEQVDELQAELDAFRQVQDELPGAPEIVPDDVIDYLEKRRAALPNDADNADERQRLQDLIDEGDSDAIYRELDSEVSALSRRRTEEIGKNAGERDEDLINDLLEQRNAIAELRDLLPNPDQTGEDEEQQGGRIRRFLSGFRRRRAEAQNPVVLEVDEDGDDDPTRRLGRRRAREVMNDVLGRGSERLAQNNLAGRFGLLRASMTARRQLGIMVGVMGGVALWRMGAVDGLTHAVDTMFSGGGGGGAPEPPPAGPSSTEQPPAPQEPAPGGAPTSDQPAPGEPPAGEQPGGQPEDQLPSDQPAPPSDEPKSRWPNMQRFPTPPGWDGNDQIPDGTPPPAPGDGTPPPVGEPPAPGPEATQPTFPPEVSPEFQSAFADFSHEAVKGDTRWEIMTDFIEQNKDTIPEGNWENTNGVTKADVLADMWSSFQERHGMNPDMLQIGETVDYSADWDKFTAAEKQTIIDALQTEDANEYLTKVKPNFQQIMDTPLEADAAPIEANDTDPVQTAEQALAEKPHAITFDLPNGGGEYTIDIPQGTTAADFQGLIDTHSAILESKGVPQTIADYIVSNTIESGLEAQGIDVDLPKPDINQALQELNSIPEFNTIMNTPFHHDGGSLWNTVEKLVAPADTLRGWPHEEGYTTLTQILTDMIIDNSEANGFDIHNVPEGDYTLAQLGVKPEQLNEFIVRAFTETSASGYAKNVMADYIAAKKTW